MTDEIKNPQTNHQNVKSSDGVRGKFDFNGFTTFESNGDAQVKSQVLGDTIRKTMEQAGGRGSNNTGENSDHGNNVFKAELGGIPLK